MEVVFDGYIVGFDVVVVEVPCLVSTCWCCCTLLRSTLRRSTLLRCFVQLSLRVVLCSMGDIADGLLLLKCSTFLNILNTFLRWCSQAIRSSTRG